MRLSDIFALAQTYVYWGLAVVLFLLLAFFLLYKLVLKKSGLSFSRSQLVLWCLFIIYIVVLFGATLGSRGVYYEGMAELQLFGSYKAAWNSFDPYEWRNLILNILMFVPLGFFLPWLVPACRRLVPGYFIGFLLSLMIECGQLISGFGIFELDDILNNTMGYWLGYGIIMLFLPVGGKQKTSANNRKKPGKLYKIMLQLPLFVVIVGFSGMMLVYWQQDLGNLSIRPAISQDMRAVAIESKIDFDDTPAEFWVYQAKYGDEESARTLAADILAVVGSKVDPNHDDIYDKSALFKSADTQYSVWVEYKGMTVSYTDFSLFYEDGQAFLAESQVSRALAPFGLPWPQDNVFKDLGDGDYRIDVDMQKLPDGSYVYGYLAATIAGENQVKGFDDSLILCEPYAKFAAISEEAAWQRLKAGDFVSYIAENELTVWDCDIAYVLDSKGFLQPVYRFWLDEEMTRYIDIPALF
jgi:glycopeptide antibiotics resistance protein